jgi:hypothetical protein
MSTSTDELRRVSLDDRPLPHSHAALVHVGHGWYVALDGVPRDSRPLVRQIGRLTLETLNGDRYAGAAVADLVREDSAHVVLDGIGPLQLVASGEA